MQNIVSKQTAIALRNAGFPQPPSVEHGQSWYSCHDEVFYIESAFHKTGILPYQWFACYPAYAPTATEILPHFSVPHLLWYDDEKQWCCTHVYYSATELDEVFAHENPAEAVAAAWLAYNRNK